MFKRRACLAVAAAMAPIVFVPAAAYAQAKQGAVELPPIVVTTTSPIVKPTNKKGAAGTKAASKAAIAPAKPVAAVSGLPPVLPLPGGVVADEAFVPVTVTTARELEASRGETITDTLMQKPGISG